MDLFYKSSISKNKIHSKSAEGQIHENKFTQKFIPLGYFHSPLIIYSVFSRVKKRKYVHTPTLSLTSFKEQILEEDNFLIFETFYQFCENKSTNYLVILAIRIQYTSNIKRAFFFQFFSNDILPVTKPFCFSSNFFSFKFPKKIIPSHVNLVIFLQSKMSHKMSLFLFSFLILESDSRK